jgi:hypothetical protein
VNSDLLADSHNILNRWKNYFSQLLNVHNVSDVRQIEVYTAEPLVPGTDEIPAELIQARGEILLSANHKPINSVWNKEEFPDQWKESIIVLVHKNCHKTDYNDYRGISLLSTSYKIMSNILLSRLSLYIDEIIGDHQCGF